MMEGIVYLSNAAIADGVAKSAADEPSARRWDEVDTLRRLRMGDLSALDGLVMRYQVEMVRTAYLIVRDRAAAEDVAQTIFVRLAERIHQYDPQRPFAPYLYRSILHEAIKQAAKRERSLSMDADLADGDMTLADLLPDWSNDPAAQFEQAEIRRAVWDAMGKLPPKQRAAAVMRFYLDWSEADMAAALNVPVGTVKWRVHDARARLQKLLAPLMTAALAAWLAR
ncbi:MAG: sigma-70 family RNA polymerase sigma factor [Anaerolineae bacterium]